MPHVPCRNPECPPAACQLIGPRMAARNVTVDFPRSYSGTSTEADAKLYWESYQDVGHKMLPVEFSTMREGF